jgi:two-component sensor histidine kinase/PAS domain-containing protein
MKGVTVQEANSIRQRSNFQLRMPIVRTLAQRAGALALVCAVAAILSIGLDANVLSSLPPHAWIFWMAIVLAVIQLVCIALIWQTFLAARKRFALRLQAATGGLDDRIFVADATTGDFAVLTAQGWTADAVKNWLESIHPEDRLHWPQPDNADPQRVELRLKAEDGSWRWHRVRTMAVRNDDGAIHEWVGSLHDIHEQRLASERRDLVIGELRHRLKNLVTVIDALAQNSRHGATEPAVDQFLQRFLGRLHALGTAGDLLLAGGEGTIDAGAVVRATLAPFIGETAPQRFRIDGPDLSLSEQLGAGIGLAVHELATNALKYGALSAAEGSVSITWSTKPIDTGEEIEFVWKERGGPPPSPPEKPGFGSRMIQSVVARERAGRVNMDYQPDGLCCRIAFMRQVARAPAEMSPESA